MCKAQGVSGGITGIRTLYGTLHVLSFMFSRAIYIINVTTIWESLMAQKFAAFRARLVMGMWTVVVAVTSFSHLILAVALSGMAWSNIYRTYTFEAVSQESRYPSRRNDCLRVTDKIVDNNFPPPYLLPKKLTVCKFSLF